MAIKSFAGQNPATFLPMAILLTAVPFMMRQTKNLIFAYGSLEKTVLTSLATRFPGLATRIEDIVARLVDLCPLTVKNYYHPDMKGSWSIKNVLPTISPELNYQEVGEVQDGGMAQQAYL